MFTRPSLRHPRRNQRKRITRLGSLSSRNASLGLEPLETRSLLAVLAVPGSFATITAAVAAAAGGDTIQINPGSYAESVNVNKDVTLDASAGAVNVTALSSPLANTVSLKGTLAASGGMTWSGPILVTANTTLSSGASNLSFQNTVNGAFQLTVTGNASFAGSVGNTTPLAALTVNGPALLTNGSVQTTGAQIYNGAVSINSAAVNLQGSSVSFENTLDGATNLSVTGATTFKGAVGSLVPLNSLIVNGTAAFPNFVDVTTAGPQTYNSPVTATSGTFVGTTITFNDKLDGPGALVFQVNLVDFQTLVGGVTPLASLTVNGTTAVNGGIAGGVTTTGAQHYNTVVVGAPIPTLTGPEIEINGLLQGVGPININGTTASDQFKIPLSDAVTVQVDGFSPVVGDPGVPPGGDRLFVNSVGSSATIVRVGSNGSITAPGRATINFTNIEIAAVSDPNEQNETRTTATFLGSNPFVAIPNLSIDSSTDVDYYRYVAHYTGKLIVKADFTAANGALDLVVEDAAGNTVSTGLTVTDGKETVIPVVAGQTYYIRVNSTSGDGNVYGLELENFLPPVPSAPQLDPDSDTGKLNNDAITRDNTPTYFISVDLASFVDSNADTVLANNALEPTVLTPAQAAAGNIAGFAVQVFFTSTTNPANNQSYYAQALDPLNPTLFTVTVTTPLSNDKYLVTSAVRSIDNKVPHATGLGNRSAASLLTIDTFVSIGIGFLPDMLPSSDSGFSNSDNVTNIQSPAFDGTGPVGAKVRLYANGRLVGEGYVNSDPTNGVVGDGLGLWEITSEPLTDNVYQITAEYEDMAGNIVSTTQAEGTDGFLTIEVDTLAPNTPLLDLHDVSDTGRSNNDNITKAANLDFTATTEDPNAAIHLFANNLTYRLFDRLQSASETKVYDSALIFAGPTNLNLVTTTAVNPTEGNHGYKLEVEDRAGNISDDFLLPVVVDRTAPAIPTLLVSPSTLDSGVNGFPATNSDRITNNVATAFTGRAEANAIVRVWVDGNPISAGTVDGSDTLDGLTVAVPLDGNQAFAGGSWSLTPRFSLNDSTLFPLDGERQITATAEDVAGNENSRSEPALLDLMVDTQGPQITSVYNPSSPSYNLFAVKAGDGSPTPLTTLLNIDFVDNPLRTTNFAYNPFLPEVLTNVGNYHLIGDHVGNVTISSITIVSQSGNPGEQGKATVQLQFASPLADDRYTLVVDDNLVDVAGNHLDGETNGNQAPVGGGTPVFATGNATPGGSFSTRFTVDTRPEVGTYSSSSVSIDINGNQVWDPTGSGNDSTNRDLQFTLQLAPAIQGLVSPMGVHDSVFAGNFARPTAGEAISRANGFDKLAAYGFDPVVNAFRWLIDIDGDGIIDLSKGDIVRVQPAGFQINGQPTAGNWDNNSVDGQEVSLFDGQFWWFDKNHDFVIDATDVGLGGKVATNIFGYPIVGDFDGNGKSDLATWRDDKFYFDLANGAGAFGTFGVKTINFGFPGVAEKPVAADMDFDGVTDVGLFVPHHTTTTPESEAQWYFLISNDFSVGAAPHAGLLGTVNALNHPFSPTPLGQDLFLSVMDEFALPIVGNFDPPTSPASGASTAVVANSLGNLLGSTQGTSTATTGNRLFEVSALRDGQATIQVTAPAGSSGLVALLYDAQMNVLQTVPVNGNGSATLATAAKAGQKLTVGIQGTSSGNVSVSIKNTVADTDRFDVTRDGKVTPLDVLQIINFLNSHSSSDSSSLLAGRLYLDSTMDGLITPLDVLQIINHLNLKASSGQPLAGTNLVGLSLALPATPATVSGTPSASVAAVDSVYAVAGTTSVGSSAPFDQASASIDDSLLALLASGQSKDESDSDLFQF